MQKKIRAVYMRGGSSKAVFFHDNHLPRDQKVRDQVILKAFGSPDPFKRQIDGMGGAISSTSKVAIISPSCKPDIDVNYNFGQVSIDRPIINYEGNCGNISSAVGPFAIEEGLVKAEEPITKVRIFQVNTKKIIIAEVPVENGYPMVDGDFVVDGVPGTGAKITLRYLEPGGAITGKLLPTGNVKDTIRLPGKGRVTISIIDASNPVVFVKAEDIGLKGTEIYEIDASFEIQKILENIRAQVAVILGFSKTVEEASAKSQSYPMIAFVSKPQDYKTVSGIIIKNSEIDLIGRIMSMGALHKAYAGTGAICTAGAAKIEGTVVNEVSLHQVINKDEIRLGHPGGIMLIKAKVVKEGDSFKYSEAIIDRTARRLMEGYVLVPDLIKDNF